MYDHKISILAAINSNILTIFMDMKQQKQTLMIVKAVKSWCSWYKLAAKHVKITVNAVQS
jgi:hypothetical protein